MQLLCYTTRYIDLVLIKLLTLLETPSYCLRTNKSILVCFGIDLRLVLRGPFSLVLCLLADRRKSERRDYKGFIRTNANRYQGPGLLSHLTQLTKDYYHYYI